MRRKFCSKLTVALLAYLVLTVNVYLDKRIGVAKASTSKINRYFYGVGEPLLYRSAYSSERLNVTKAFELMKYMNVSGLREWVWRWIIFDGNETSLNQTYVEALNTIVAQAKSHDIEIMGMVPDFPSWMTGIQEKNKTIQYAVPRRNLTEGSPYMVFLQKYEKSWETLARESPEIKMWEIGNEYNLDEFLHSENDNFTEEDKVDIVTDLLYYGSRGIKRGNPEATTVIGGLGPGGNGIYDIRDFLDRIYENIESGNWPSTNPNDFFEVACWHPYIGVEKPTEQNWVEPNNAVYNVMVAHGDVNKSVFFSEFGYSDVYTGLNENDVAERLRVAFTLAMEHFSWLETIYWFRLIDPDPCYDKGLNPTEYGFGLVKRPAENYALKPAAEAYREIVPEFPSALILLLLLTTITIIIVLVKKKLSVKSFRLMHVQAVKDFPLT